MISPCEVQRKYVQKKNSSTHFGMYDGALETKIDDTLEYEQDENVVRCKLVFDSINTYQINTLFKYIDAGYNILISNESDKKDITLTIYCYFQ